jgi:lysophospholipase L1-like esterase
LPTSKDKALQGDPIRYLALGDSYTIGTGASKPARNYPSILATRLSEATGRKVDLTNPAVNGFTTLDLIDAELKYVGRLLPQLVTILIGVNDLVQGRTPEEYGASLRKIYDAVASLGLPAGRAIAISLPNWSIVPAARDFGDPARLRRLTDALNTIAKNEAESRAFTWIDISAASVDGAGTKGWISGDRLHPGDSQYAAWASVIWDVVKGTWTAVD